MYKMFHLGLLSEDLSPVLGSPPGERRLCSEMSPVEGHRAGQRVKHGVYKEALRQVPV